MKLELIAALLLLSTTCLLAALLAALQGLRRARRQLEDHAWLANATPAPRPRRRPPGETTIGCGRCGWEGRQSSLEERRCPSCGAAFMRVVA